MSQDVVKGVMAGMVAGLAASLAMDLFQQAYGALSRGPGRPDGPEEDEPATVKVANRLAIAARGRRLPDEYGPYAGQAVHYGTGLAMGAVYGATAETQPVVTAGAGAAYGGAIWTAVDEGLVPAVRLGPRPWQAGLAEHAYGLVSHIVFGLALEATRRAVRRAL